MDHDAIIPKVKHGPPNEIPKRSPVLLWSGKMHLARGALLARESAEAFGRDDFAAGAVLAARAAEAFCDGALLLGAGHPEQQSPVPTAEKRGPLLVDDTAAQDLEALRQDVERVAFGAAKEAGIDGGAGETALQLLERSIAQLVEDLEDIREDRDSMMEWEHEGDEP